MTSTSFWQTEPWLPLSWYQGVVKNRAYVQTLFRLVYIATMANIALGALIFVLEPLTYYGLMLEVGQKFGSLAALTYCATLLPSILQRLRILPRTGALFMLWRRQLGVSMFLFALAHMMLVRTIPLLFTDPASLAQANTSVLFGMISLMILFPLWLTSNDPAHKLLGKWWKRLHRLTYLALVAIMIHVAYADLALALVLGVTLVAELASWLVFWRRPAATV